jgi:CheY-like chemotaxis protein
MKQEQPSQILVVDDISDNIQIAANILKTENYQISFAMDGRNAIYHAQNKPCDLILLDIMMPEMDGYAVAKNILENPMTRHIPIIFLTAKNDQDSIEKAYLCGGVDYITKPFLAKELLSRVKTHLQLKQKEKLLLKSNETKDKFFSLIAHDLRSPIFSVREALRTLKDNQAQMRPDDFQDLLNATFDSSTQVFELLEKLLFWAKIQKDDIVYQPHPNELFLIVSEILKIFSSLFAKKN